MQEDKLILGGCSFSSRFILGSGKYSLPLIKAAAVMTNTAIATAGDIPLMAAAFKQAVEAGRAAYLAGPGRVLEQGAAASSPLTGFLEDR